MGRKLASNWHDSDMDMQNNMLKPPIHERDRDKYPER